mmetsp:Transcript_10995/g.31241  ORF Transcript_10995/g.31241 Transcript_10995/m.31241 type:complete len:155 (-) Transcript_10995:213-677(-)|eukprot:CAMPEP_0202057080 /NCGR_PEP_ID=MMETSP0963-20130614/26879_1 /ASSEMBLY_ACC=CAM_ASM_000494 /TAXON_ID=4773 /ORGANISM="Schizochytrium aggregatum, Strain ATCC28209" /LENGTH=154 /DNA_ID=CAMNT_0048622891 /DNA_START=130 /DNA_END=594 /DNA_ORIENTATION=-
MATERRKFEHQGRTIYEWEQSLNEVLIFITPPAGVKASDLSIKITKTHLTVGLKNVERPFIDEEFFDTVVTDESYWTMDDGVIEINVQKMRKAATWDAALKGHGALDPLAREDIQKKMTLERFQEEHPGFDFSGAEFSGSAPDPRNFMGGVPYK